MGKLIKAIATFGLLGFLPASGTLGSLVALPCAYLLTFIPLFYQYAICVFIGFAALLVIQQALRYFTYHDPSQIIIDEFVGMLLTLLGFSYDRILFFSGFLLFRFFDIVKPFGIRYVEKLPGAYGILLDDCLAGLCAHLILRFLVS